MSNQKTAVMKYNYWMLIINNWLFVQNWNFDFGFTFSTKFHNKRVASACENLLWWLDLRCSLFLLVVICWKPKETRCEPRDQNGRFRWILITYTNYYTMISTSDHVILNLIPLKICLTLFIDVVIMNFLTSRYS